MRTLGPPNLIILDRDVVLNQIVVHSEQGTIDSPMNVGEVILIPGAADAVAILTAELGALLQSLPISRHPRKTTRSFGSRACEMLAGSVVRENHLS